MQILRPHPRPGKRPFGKHCSASLSPPTQGTGCPPWRRPSSRSLPSRAICPPLRLSEGWYLCEDKLLWRRRPVHSHDPYLGRCWDKDRGASGLEGDLRALHEEVGKCTPNWGERWASILQPLPLFGQQLFRGHCLSCVSGPWVPEGSTALLPRETPASLSLQRYVMGVSRESGENTRALTVPPPTLSPLHKQLGWRSCGLRTEAGGSSR